MTYKEYQSKDVADAGRKKYSDLAGQLCITSCTPDINITIIQSLLKASLHPFSKLKATQVFDEGKQ